MSKSVRSYILLAEFSTAFSNPKGWGKCVISLTYKRNESWQECMSVKQYSVLDLVDRIIYGLCTKFHIYILYICSIIFTSWKASVAGMEA